MVEREPLKELWFGVFVAILVAVASFVAGAWSAYEDNQRLQRLERIERIDSIGRRY